MPLGKYYCDYCGKQFQDTPSARKRHLQGLQHLRAKAQWFHSLNATNDPNHSFTEPFAKGLCNRFLKTGFCQYGDNCKYFHPKKDSPTTNPQAAPEPAPGGVEGAGMGMTWGNLPPSLKPPPEGGYPPLPFVDWG
ncbi:zinc finger CCCH domain-containing protein 3-like [Durio zibethinus]|uniref:Zinc finger CCCH domain-containing protein 3-like n=1 Tax=Durio zibethinus TaxID=66656 RepID=A0A6P5WVR1_DURZI|nr:zinc finger CCCH domain-containing protein 3-like isoform X2 [Durio zibethinus]XP_022719594.1 zinc finger CCCH domain-containing protein 3-like [Durio zibethinus]